MYQNEPALLNVSFKKSRAGNFIATVRILTKNQVKWRRVSGRINTKKNELFYQAISLGRKHCKGPVSYQLPLVDKNVSRKF